MCHVDRQFHIAYMPHLFQQFRIRYRVSRGVFVSETHLLKKSSYSLPSARIYFKPSATPEYMPTV